MTGAISAVPARTQRRGAHRPSPPSGPRRPPRYDWVDRFIASDPGFNRLRMGLQVAVSIAAALAAERVFVGLTGALQHPVTGLPPAAAAAVSAGNHAMLVMSMMVGAMVCMMATFAAPMAASVSRLYLTILLMPLPMIAGLATGLATGRHRGLALVLLTLILTGGAYLRRFGPWGFFGGQLLFMGDFTGFFLGSQVGFSTIAWLAPEVCVGALMAAAAQLLLFHPSRRRTLRRLRRSFGSRARALVDAALDVLDDPADRHARRSLERRTVRLNEAALMIDAALGTPGTVPAEVTAAQLHQVVFDAEQALRNMGRFTATLARLGLHRGDRAVVRMALTAVGRHDAAGARTAALRLLDRLHEHPAGPPADATSRHRRVVLHRFATSVQDWSGIAADPFRPRPDAAGQIPQFSSSVELVGGWLPGSSMVSASASTERGPRRIDRVRLAPNVRVAVQIGVAVSGAILLGSLLSERRFYWAVIAAFVTFMGANNSLEQVRKGLLRVFGTLVGVFIGSLLAHAIGHHTDLAVLTVLVAIGLGIYLLRISYAFMVIGITVMVSQMYVQLGEYSDALLRLRLEETAIGAAVAIVTVLVVFPLRSWQVVRVAARAHADAVQALADGALRRVTGDCADMELRAAARTLDAAHQTLVASLRPLRGLPGPGSEVHRGLRSAADASVHRARMMLRESGRIARGCTAGDGLRPDAPQLDDARAQLAGSLQAIVDALTEDHRAQDFVYTRSASRFDVIATARADAEQVTTEQLLLRDARLLDESMAAFAAAADLQVRALDDAAPAPTRPTPPTLHAE